MIKRTIIAAILMCAVSAVFASGCLESEYTGSGNISVDGAYISSDGENVTLVVEGGLNGSEIPDRANITVERASGKGKKTFNVTIPAAENSAETPSENTANQTFTEEIVLEKMNDLEDGSYVVFINGKKDDQTAFDMNGGILSVRTVPSVHSAFVSMDNDSLILHIDGHLRGSAESFDTAAAVVTIGGNEIVITAPSSVKLNVPSTLDLPPFEADIPLRPAADFKPGTYTVVLNGKEMTKIIVEESETDGRTISYIGKAGVRDAVVKTENGQTAVIVSGVLSGRNEVIDESGIKTVQNGNVFEIVLPTKIIISKPNTRDFVPYGQTIVLGEDLPSGEYVVKINNDADNMIGTTVSFTI